MNHLRCLTGFWTRLFILISANKIVWPTNQREYFALIRTLIFQIYLTPFYWSSFFHSPSISIPHQPSNYKKAVPNAWFILTKRNLLSSSMFILFRNKNLHFKWLKIKDKSIEIFLIFQELKILGETRFNYL